MKRGKNKITCIFFIYYPGLHLLAFTESYGNFLQHNMALCQQVRMHSCVPISGILDNICRLWILATTWEWSCLYRYLQILMNVTQATEINGVHLLIKSGLVVAFPQLVSTSQADKWLGHAQILSFGMSNGWVYDEWEHNYNDLANIWLVYCSMNAGKTNQPCNQYESSPISLYNIKVWVHLSNTPDMGMYLNKSSNLLDTKLKIRLRIQNSPVLRILDVHQSLSCQTATESILSGTDAGIYK